MATEIEAKIKVPDHEAIRQRIRVVGGEHVGDYFETNTFFDTADGRLRAADQGLRIRQLKNLFGPRGQSGGRTTYLLTFKGPAQESAVKQREEIETEITDGDAIKSIVESLGFAERLTFEKKRQTWKVGNCQVELDDLPMLGTFVEIEGPDVQSVETVRAELGLADEPLIKPGYSSMLAKELERTRGGNVARFADATPGR
jgi:adenylate cyclase class 2